MEWNSDNTVRQYQIRLPTVILLSKLEHFPVLLSDKKRKEWKEQGNEEIYFDNYHVFTHA